MDDEQPSVLPPPGYWSKKYAYVPLDYLVDDWFLGVNIAHTLQPSEHKPLEN